MLRSLVPTGKAGFPVFDNPNPVNVGAMTTKAGRRDDSGAVEHWVVPESLNPGLNFRNSVTSPPAEVVPYRGDQQSSTAGRFARDPLDSVLSFISFLLISFIRTMGRLSSEKIKSSFLPLSALECRRG